jgi:hypothetical protein
MTEQALPTSQDTSSPDQQEVLPVVGVISQEDANILAGPTNNGELTQEQQKVVDFLGGAAVSGVALAVGFDKDTRQVTTNYVRVGKNKWGANETGTTIKSHNYDKFGLTNPGDLLGDRGVDEGSDENQLVAAQASDLAKALKVGGRESTGSSDISEALGTDGVPEQESESLPELTTESRASTSAEAEEPAGQARAMQELRDTWGLPEGVTAEQASQRLAATAEELGRIVARSSHDSDLAQRVQSVRQGLLQSINENAMRVNVEQLQTMSHELQNLQANILTVTSDPNQLLPVSGRQRLEEAIGAMPALLGATDAVAPPWQPGFIDMGAAEQTYSILTQHSPIEQGLIVAGSLLTEVERMQAALSSGTEAESSAEVEQFVDERIAELADKLRKEGVSDDEIETATVQMERYVNDAIADKSSGLTYPSRVVANDQTMRKGGARIGQKGDSRRITAEMAVAMLQGDFDVANTPDQITVAADGTVVDGQHRAAALMTLYGKNWIIAGQKAGHKIKKS